MRMTTMFFGLSVLAAGTYLANHFAAKQKNAKFDPGIQYSVISHTAKARRTIQAQLELEGEAPESPGDEFRLRVKVTSTHSASDILLKWALPSGVEIVQGSLETHISDLAVGSEETVEAVFLQASEVNEQIHLKVSGIATGMKSSQTLQYNSLDQERIDLENKNLRELASEEMKKDVAIKALEKGESHTHSHLAE